MRKGRKYKTFNVTILWAHKIATSPKPHDFSFLIERSLLKSIRVFLNKRKNLFFLMKMEQLMQHERGLLIDKLATKPPKKTMFISNWLSLHKICLLLFLPSIIWGLAMKATSLVTAIGLLSTAFGMNYDRFMQTETPDPTRFPTVSTIKQVIEGS